MLPLLPTNGLNDSTAHKRTRESINGILRFDFDKSRTRTEAEKIAGIYPVNPSYPPGHVLRYGDNTDPGVTDMTTAINAALSSSGGALDVIIPPETVRFTSTITIPTGVRVIGSGYTSDPSSGGRAKSTLLKDFDGQGVIVGDDSAIERLQVDNVAGRTGDNIQITGTRARALYVTSTNAGQDGFRVGTDAAVANTNLWLMLQCISIYNTRHGLLIDDPTGLTDAGAGNCVGGDFRSNGGDGIQSDNSTWNTFTGIASQDNTGIGFRITTNSRSITVLGGDIEGNAGGYQGVLESGTFSNTIIGQFYNPGSSTWVDNSGFVGRNVLLQYRNAINRAAYGAALALSNPGSGGEATIDLYTDTGEGNSARIIAGQVGTTGGRLRIQTKVDGNVPVDALIIDQLQRVSAQAALVRKLKVVTYSASMTFDASTGNEIQITPTDASAFTINAPTNPSDGQTITYMIRNSSGGALGAVTWNAVFKMSAWTSPANGNSRSITFRYDGSNWVQVSQTGVDVPN